MVEVFSVLYEMQRHSSMSCMGAVGAKTWILFIDFILFSFSMQIVSLVTCNYPINLANWWAPAESSCFKHLCAWAGQISSQSVGERMGVSFRLTFFVDRLSFIFILFSVQWYLSVLSINPQLYYSKNFPWTLLWKRVIQYSLLLSLMALHIWFKFGFLM